MKSITGFVVNMSNSVELTSFDPTTSRANSITAHCRPRHRPRYGTRAVTGEVRGQDLALDPAMPEPAGHDDARRAIEGGVEGVLRERLRVDPADLDVDIVSPAGVLQRLGDGEVGVGKLDVLADEGDLELRLVALDPLHQRPPAREIRCRVGVAEGQLPHDQPAEAVVLELEGTS